MEFPSIRNKHQQQRSLHEIIQARRDKAAGMQPPWYHLAQSRNPEMYKEAVRLLKDQYRLEALSENKTATLHKWTRVEHQLREKMPTDFDTLDRLQQHIETWTTCNREKIAQLFEGAVTKTERLSVLLGASVTFPSAKEVLQLEQQPDPQNVDDHETDISVDSGVDSHQNVKAERRRRYRENRRKRAAAAAAVGSAPVEDLADAPEGPKKVVGV